MNKTLIALSAVLILGLAAACGEAAPPPTPTEPDAPTQTVPPPTPSPAPTETLTPTIEIIPMTETPAAETVVAESQVGFASSVFPILEAKCVKCHGVEQVKEGLNLLTYADLMAGSFNGPVVIPGDADKSLLVDLIVRGKMPNRGTKVTEEELQIIKDWINQGALNN